MIEANYYTGSELAEARVDVDALTGRSRHQFIRSYEMLDFGSRSYSFLMHQVEIGEPVTPAEIDLAAKTMAVGFEGLKNYYRRKGTIDIDTLSMTDVVEIALGDRAKHLEYAEKGEARLDAYKKEYIELAVEASLYYGLPLTPDQIKSRLEGVILGFGIDIQEDGSGDIHGVYYGGIQHRALVDAFLSPADERYAAFHELTHALSGQRNLKPNHAPCEKNIRRIGLANFQGNNKIINESITDTIGAAFQARIPLDFAAEEYDHSREEGWAQMKYAADMNWKMYGDFKYVFNELYPNVDPKLIFAAYFKSDFDSLEADQLAGTHALRDLQRAIKVAGGSQRIKQLRLFEKALLQNNQQYIRDLYSEMIRHDEQATDDVRARERASVEQHTRRYRQKIAVAKTYARPSTPHK